MAQKTGNDVESVEARRSHFTDTVEEKLSRKRVNETRRAHIS